MDVVICATNTNVELFDGSRLVPGQHVTGIIGSNKQLVQGGFLKKARREIDDATAVKADVIVTNLKESMVSEEQGDLFGPIERGLSVSTRFSNWAISLLANILEELQLTRLPTIKITTEQVAPRWRWR